MRRMIPVVCVTLLSSAALAAPSAKGDKAASLTRAIKFAGVKPTTAKTVRTFKVAALGCWSSTEGEDEQLGDYKCTLDKLTVKGGLAVLLEGAMEAAGIASSDHMSQHTTDATAVTCVVDPTKQGDDRFQCTWTPKS